MQALLNIFSGNRPDITPAQIIALLVAVVAVIFFDFTTEEGIALGALVVGLVGSDAAVRVGRNVKDGKVEAAALTSTSEPTENEAARDAAHLLGTGRGGVHEDILSVDTIDVADEAQGLAHDYSSDPEADAVQPDEALAVTDEEELGEARSFGGPVEPGEEFPS